MQQDLLKFNARYATVITALVYLVALNLRPALTSVGPILPELGKELNLGESLQGVLGALPLLAFATISPIVHRFSSRLGIERTIFISLIVLAAGTILRSYAGMTGLWLGTFIIGSAIAVGNVLVPTLVRRDYSGHISLATSIYSACISLAASIASALAAPIAHATNWKVALAFWAIPALVVATLWILRTIPKPVFETAPTADEAASDENVWANKTAWILTGMMATQGTIFYTLVNWIPTLEISRGLTANEAGIHLFIYQTISILSGFLVPFLMRNPYSQLPATISATIPLIIGITGLLLVPNLGGIWVAICGIGSGMSMPTVLALISLRGHTTHRTTRLSGMAQSIGYLLAAFGPSLFGYFGEHTGNWKTSLIFLATISIFQLIIAFPAGKEKLLYKH
ncbi:MAG: MFS transporter [Micrococcaceae bacterium]